MENKPQPAGKAEKDIERINSLTRALTEGAPETQQKRLELIDEQIQLIEDPAAKKWLIDFRRTLAIMHDSKSEAPASSPDAGKRGIFRTIRPEMNFTFDFELQGETVYTYYFDAEVMKDFGHSSGAAVVGEPVGYSLIPKESREIIEFKKLICD